MLTLLQAQHYQDWPYSGNETDFGVQSEQTVRSVIGQANGPLRSLLEHQHAVLAGQEQAILAPAGVPQAMSQVAVVKRDGADNGQDDNGSAAKRPDRANVTAPSSVSDALWRPILPRSSETSGASK